MAPHVETIPRAFVTRLCEIVVEATHMRMDRENLMETLDNMGYIRFSRRL